MFQDDINRSSFDTSYSTNTFFVFFHFCFMIILLLLVKVVMIEKSNKIIVVKLLLIPAIGNSLKAIYSVISRLGSIYGASRVSMTDKFN